MAEKKYARIEDGKVAEVITVPDKDIVMRYNIEFDKKTGLATKSVPVSEKLTISHMFHHDLVLKMVDVTGKTVAPNMLMLEDGSFQEPPPVKAVEPVKNRAEAVIDALISKGLITEEDITNMVKV